MHVKRSVFLFSLYPAAASYHPSASEHVVHATRAARLAPERPGIAGHRDPEARTPRRWPAGDSS